jgi:hypothetical protein
VGTAAGIKLALNHLIAVEMVSLKVTGHSSRSGGLPGIGTHSPSHNYLSGQPALSCVLLLQIGFATSLALVEQTQGDVDKFMQIFRACALYAPTFDKKLPKMLSHDYGE